jgi:hypothetical protein
MIELFLVVLGAVLGSVVTWLLPNREAQELRKQLAETERRHAAQDRETRILRVLDQYMQFRRSNYTGGYDGLLRSGVATLEANAEIEELLRRVVEHGEAHPLGSNHSTVFAGVDLLRLFKYAAEKRINFLTTPIEAVIRSSGSKES